MKKNNEALRFAYAMGLKNENDTHETVNDAKSFAYAMGLKRYNGNYGVEIAPETDNTTIVRPIGKLKLA